MLDNQLNMHVYWNAKEKLVNSIHKCIYIEES